jgi:hypothetical protein
MSLIGDNNTATRVLLRSELQLGEVFPNSIGLCLVIREGEFYASLSYFI